ncbi:MAG: hypothetical protein ACXWCZ_09235 [Flavisolibacter sp.]
MKKLPRLIVFFILYTLGVIIVTYYFLPIIKPQEYVPEASKNIIEILRLAIKSIAGGTNTDASQLRDYLILIFLLSLLMFVLIQIYIKRIKWKYLVLCPLGLMIFGFMIFELIRIFPGIGSTAENNRTFYLILSVSMVTSCFISIRYMYHEVFTGKQKPRKIAIPRRHA